MLEFAKYHGTGNDFVMVADPGDAIGALAPAEIAALCDRRFGVGADGLIRVAPSKDPGADFFMDYANADGSGAEMCGNGIRCLGKLVYDRGLTTETELEIETRAGRKHLSLDVRDGKVQAVTVDMGPPALERGAIPMIGTAGARFQMEAVEAGGATFKGTAVSMGNPHLVLFVDRDPAEVDVAGIAPKLEHSDLFPEDTNVEFVSVADGVLVTRVWERGSGETMACGTGACAVLVAANEAGLVPSQADVRFPGGALRVARTESGTVLLTGPAAHVYDGRVDLALLTPGSRL